VQTPAEQFLARVGGALPDRIVPVDSATCTVDLSGDTLPCIAQMVALIDADYTLDAAPDVLAYLAVRARQTLEAIRLARSSQT